MSNHFIYLPELLERAAARAAGAGVITIGGDEAHHAIRVKRLEAGDTVRVCDGKGRVARGRVAATRKARGGWEIDIEAGGVEVAEKVTPRVVVASAVPKGDRLETMIDGLSQVGVAEWRPLVTAHGVVEPREGKLSRLERVTVEALKQSGRAWVMEIGESVTVEGALSACGVVVMADASGGEYVARGGVEEVTLLVGPEGGWSGGELEMACARGAMVARFGVHVMRIEVAAVVGAGIVMVGTTPALE